MGLPKQVEEAADQAEEYIKGLNSEESSEATEESETEEETATTEDDTEDAKEEVDTFENKYKSLKGKYDAEVPRLHTELKELKENIFSKIEELSVNREPEKTEDEPTQDYSDKLAAFKEEYGEDLMGYLDAYFDSKVQPTLDKHTKESITPLQDKITNVEDSQTNAAQVEFASYLNNNVNGDWQTAVGTPEFDAFLQKEDPNGMYTYGELMNKFNSDWDEVRMAKVFNQFFPEEKTEEKVNKGVSDKDALISPSRQTKTKAPEADNKIQWTEESIKQFEQDDRRGKFSSEESKELWDDLLAALGDNRIT